ncbi:hypothetical protein NEH16_13250 [Streptomyces drozdowiczii]|uniref:Uncharacterized protein n=1 Tax=Streptomyces drozdowiczii TaxID=202862 RepID=A0ABY6PSR3_9ACTN|nr:hypothetical protein [Streptomyces drozdowiczii]UZK54974.1 hypothetical protein NEH16_13250 [Streptomyces drozdowiczii]
MYVFMDPAPGDEPGRDDDELLVRTAMERATGGAPPLPDLVPGALVQGRRRRARARAAIGATATAIVGLGIFGAALPVWGGGGEPVREWSAASSATAVPTPLDTSDPWLRLPVHVEPSPGETSMADLPEREYSRQGVFQNEAAGVLEALLPKALAPVRPVDIAVSRYQGGVDSPVFPISFSVRPLATGKAARADTPCLDGAVKDLRCDEVTLPGGIKAQAITAAGNAKGGKKVTGVTVRFRYGHSRVTLTVGGDYDAMVSAPVTADQLVAVAGDPKVIEMVAYADKRPMEAKEGSVRGG